MKIPLLLLIVATLDVNALNVKETSKCAKKPRSVEEFRDLELDELIKSLEKRIKDAKEAMDSREAIESTKGVVGQPKDSTSSKPQSCGRADVFQPQIRPVNPRSRGSNEATGGTKVPSRLEKRKISHHIDGLEELHREAYGIGSKDGSPDFKELSNLEKDEQYYRALLRLQRLYRLYNKRYLDHGKSKEDRTSRHCIGANDLDDKLDHIHSYLEKSRRLADHIADTAVHLMRKKSYLLHNLHKCGHGKYSKYDEEPDVVTIVKEPVVAVVEEEPVVAVVEEPVVAVVEEPVIAVVKEPVVVATEAKRDVEISSASSTSVDVGSVSVDTSSDIRVEAKTGSDLSVSSDLVTNTAIDTGLEGRLNIKLGSNKGIWDQLNSCEDYEKKMIMDLAIDEAAGMIRRLAHETRYGAPYDSDPEYEKRVLNLAIDFVNKVTSGVTGDLDNKLDLFGGIRYNNAEEYLQSVNIYDPELEYEPISNSGFDYVRQDLLESSIPYDLDIYSDYVGHPSPYSRGRCDSCGKFDLRVGDSCPLCKRNGHTYHGRIKRNPSGVPNGRIYHLEQMPSVQRKVM